MTRLNHTRGGLTLIELLVVLGILTLLAALVMSGVAAVRDRQMVNTTANTVNKLQDAIDTQMKAARRSGCRGPLRTRRPTSRTLLDVLRQRRGPCPSTARVSETAACVPADVRRGDEQRDSVALAGQSESTRPTGAYINWPLTRRTRGFPTSPTWSPDEQSAALLYLGLSNMGTGGNAFAYRRWLLPATRTATGIRKRRHACSRTPGSGRSGSSGSARPAELNDGVPIREQ